MKIKILLLLAFIVISCTKNNTNAEATKIVKKQYWNLASSFPKSLDSFWDRLHDISNRVSVLTDKEITIKSYQPGELVPALEVFDAVSQGSIEMGISVGNYYIGKNMAFLLDTGIPFGMRTNQKNAWLYSAGGLELIQELYKKYNIMYFPVGNTNTQMGGWFRNEINTLEDFKGLRIRISGLGGKIYDKMGATVQMLGGGEIYSALEQGTLDAAEFVGPYDDEKFGFHNIAKYYYAPGWQETSGTIALYVNLDKWNSISPKAQLAIELAAKEANLLTAAKYAKENPEAMARLKTKGVQFKTFSKDILLEAKKQSKLLLENYCAEPEFKKIYDSQIKFQKLSNKWTQTNEIHLINLTK